jgi:O-antigen/teichoic acid export membrane protein
VARLLQIASDRSGDFILPKTQGFGPSSIYEKGVNSLELVRVAIVDLFGTVLLSSLRIRSEKDPATFKPVASDILYFTILGSAVGASILAINGEAFVLTLFGGQWKASVETLKILAISTPFVCASAYLTKVMFLRQMHLLVLRTAIFTRLGVILVVLVLSHSSLSNLAIGVVIAEIWFFVLYVYLNRNNLNWRAPLLLLCIDVSICVSVAWVVNYGINKIGILPPAISFASNALGTLLTIGLIFFLIRQPSISKIKNCLNLK